MSTRIMSIYCFHNSIQAIEYAAERGSQIICMSWTIKPPEGDKKKEFDDAIHNALKQGRPNVLRGQ